jgi:hypothetical protein
LATQLNQYVRHWMNELAGHWLQLKRGEKKKKKKNCRLR